MKRIIHVIGGMDRAGAETMVMNWYRHIDRTAFQFDFVYFIDKKCDFDDEIIEMGGKIYRVYNSKNIFLRTLRLTKLLKKLDNVHALHCHTLLSNGFHVLAGKLAGVKIRISHSHNTCDTHKNNIVRKIYEYVCIFLINVFSNRFIACGVAAGDYLFTNKNKKNITLINNSVDVDYFAIMRSNIKYQHNKNKLPLQKLNIIQIGRLLPVKNHKFTLALAKRMKERNINFSLSLVGKGDLFQEISQQIEKEELHNHVFLLGIRSDISELLAHSDVLILPSIHEGFPVVLVEAQAAGIVSIISSSVSEEVDLGVGLVHFMSLSVELDGWINKIIEISTQYKISDIDRVNILKCKGFDVRSNLKNLTSVYGDMKT